MTRYALYYTPAAGSPWWSAGCRWLGRDSSRGMTMPLPALPGIAPELFARLTERPRRYGFHATLKAPFRLAQGFGEQDLLTMAQAFAERQRPVSLGTPQPQLLRNFLALCPQEHSAELGALASRCVEYFDLLRAAPSSSELEKRRATGLTPRQDALLQRWGYPYAEEAFQFHITLTDNLRNLAQPEIEALHAAAKQWFSSAANSPPSLDALTICREDEPGAPLMEWQRIPFNAAAPACAVPQPGKLFYLVGASGVGKDTLLDWVRQRLPNDANIRIARRAITRPAHATEAHEPMDAATFDQRAADGCFSLMWRANGLSYGVRRGIEADMQAGHDVIVNGSREFVPELKQCFPKASVIWVDADPAVLRSRLESRGREFGGALTRRIERASQFRPGDGGDVVRLDNSGPIEQAGRGFLRLLTR